MQSLTKLVLIVCLSVSSSAYGDGLAPEPAEKSWEVTRVIDGDTIVVAGLGKVRLLGIDAPESVHPRLLVQPCGLDASVYLHQIAYRRRVRIEVSPGASRDFYGRLLAIVWKRSGSTYVDLNLRMVRQGYARVETRWRFARMKDYLMVQEQARLAKRGIWGEKQCQ